MFNENFYPTPKNVIEQMCFGLDLFGKAVLEPSSGKGDIIDYLKELGAKVTACEIHPDLATISAKKAHRFLKHDFMKVTKEEISHIDFIIMNPPFSADEKHIMHAFSIAPDGCEIVSLCNYSTLENRYSSYRENLKSLIEKHGNSQALGNVFSTSERKTDVSIGLVHLFKPKTGDSEFEGYFDLSEDSEKEENGIMPYDEIRNIVNRYVGAVKMFEGVLSQNNEINSLTAPINAVGRISFGVTQYRDGKQYPVNREEFKKELQKSAWKSIFSKMNMDKYVTKSVMGDINKFVEQQVMVPFTMRNIYKMIEMIVGTHGSRMEKVLVDAFDKICSFSYENSEAGEKWKTNSSYKVNQKFILPHIVGTGWSGQFEISTYAHERQSDMDDIVKALCFMTGKNYADFTDIRTFISNTPILDESGNKVLEKDSWNRFKYRYLEFGKWYEWNEFFEIRGYKKGTLHVKFKSEKVWMQFNTRVAKIKGWALPKNTDTKQKGTERTRKTGVEIF